MKTFNNTVGSFRSSPAIKALHHVTHSPLAPELPKHSEYGTLSKAVSKHLKRKKKKDSVLLQMQLEDTIRRQIQSEQRCHSVDKLMFLNRQKNEEIRRHIVEKANLQSQNQELKMLMISPSERQLELQRKVNQLQIELAKTRSQFQQKELKYKEQIQDIKREHRKEVNEIKLMYQNGTKIINVSKDQEQRISPENSRKYVQNVNYVTRQQSPPKPQNQFKNIQTIPVIKSFNANSYTYFSNSNNPQAQTYQNNNSRQNYNISPSTQVYNTKNTQEAQSYTNVFSQSSIRSANYQPTSPRREVAVQSYTYKRQLSPNTTNSTTTQIKTETSRSDINKQGQTTQEYNFNVNKSTAQPTQYQQYRNVIQKQEKMADRPTTFGSEGGSINQAQKNIQNEQSYRGVNVQKEVALQGITTKDIDDIYKKYYLND